MGQTDRHYCYIDPAVHTMRRVLISGGRKARDNWPSQVHVENGCCDESAAYIMLKSK